MRLQQPTTTAATTCAQAGLRATRQKDNQGQPLLHQRRRVPQRRMARLPRSCGPALMLPLIRKMLVRPRAEHRLIEPTLPPNVLRYPRNENDLVSSMGRLILRDV